jgi:hypothetical protein
MEDFYYNKKEICRKKGFKYQRIIRKLVDRYAEKVYGRFVVADSSWISPALKSRCNQCNILFFGQHFRCYVFAQ